jgi:hypothetical protein
MGSRSFRLRGLSVLQQRFRGVQMVFLQPSSITPTQVVNPVHSLGNTAWSSTSAMIVIDHLQT